MLSCPPLSSMSMSTLRWQLLLPVVKLAPPPIPQPPILPLMLLPMFQPPILLPMLPPIFLSRNQEYRCFDLTSDNSEQPSATLPSAN
ncbi:hypothetical protein F5H01DRAFT_352605 [Linnemannia elongata]|nr:hypothetical protein F5H01DRAFT_352605 [Linnemannia elongata]